MNKRNHEKIDSDSGTVTDRDAKEQGTHHVHDAECRCKEAKEMSFFQLVKQMMNDLSFWKSRKRRGL